MKLKGQAITCQISSCKREGKYLMRVNGQWRCVCATHERHFGRLNLEALGLPKEEIGLLMSEAYWRED